MVAAVGQEAQVLARTALGLYSQENPFSIPEGALVRAENVSLDREGIIESRRGFERYGQALSQPASDLMHYQRRLVFLEGNTIKFDSDLLGTWGTWTGSFARPTPTTRLKFVEQAGNLYWTTERGVMKNDSLTGTPVRSGMPQGLDVELAFTGVGGGIQPVNTQVGYRVIFGREDANKNLLLGAPSFRVVSVNPVTHVTMAFAGATVTVTHTAHGFATNDIIELHTADDPNYGLGPHTITVVDANTYTYPLTPAIPPLATSEGSVGRKRNVRLTITVPQGVDLKAGDHFIVGRTLPSAASAGQGSDPGLRHLQLSQKNLSAGDITTGTVTFDDDFMPNDIDTMASATPFYTNDTNETEAQANDRPPWAKHIVVWKDHVFYANISREQRVDFRLNNLAGLVAETSTITLGSYVYTFSATRDIANRKFQLHTSQPTDAQKIAATMRDFCLVVNRDPNNALYQAWYISQSQDDPGSVIVGHRAMNGPAFVVTSSQTANFLPPLPVTSTNREGKNVMARSKFQEPEAVPDDNTTLVGKATKEIHCLVPLKDGLVIGTDEGYFILSGESDGGGGFNFVLNPLAPSLDVKAPDSIVLLDDAHYGYTSQGVVRQVASGTSLASRQIHRDLNRISKFPQFTTLTHACSYETDHRYLLATQETKGDTLTKLIWNYNHLTGAWTNWRLTVNAMLVIPTPDDRLYLAHGEDNFILKERKSLTVNLEDYVDWEITATITAVGVDATNTRTTVDVTYSYSEPLIPGFGFIQNQALATVKAVVDAVTTLSSSSFRLTLDRLATVEVTTCILGIPIQVKVEWMPEDAGNPALVKQYTYCTITPESNTARRHHFGFMANHQRAFDFATDTILEPRTGWGSNPWGSSPWGDSSQAKEAIGPRVMVPKNHQQCATLRVLYQHTVAREKASIAQMALDYKVIGPSTMRKTGLKVVTVSAQAGGMQFVPSPLPEFYGFGSVTRGHLDAPAGFDIYHVTTLLDNGLQGSLRHAIVSKTDGTRGRLIVFDVGGDMLLDPSSTLEIRTRSYFTIDGFTAPNPGFRIIIQPEANNPSSALTVESTSSVSTHDIIIRGLHFYGYGEGLHPGEGDILAIDGSFPGGGGLGVHRVIFDRNSCLAAPDGVFDIFRNAADISYTRNLIGKTLDVTNWNTGSAAAGEPPGVERLRITMAHNLWTRCNGRQPRITWKSWDIDIVNNVVHGWGWYEGGAQGLRLVGDNGTDSARLNFEDNFYKFVANPQGLSVVEDDAISWDVAFPQSNIQLFMSGNTLPPGEVTTTGNAAQIAIPAYAQVPRISALAVIDAVGARQRNIDEQLIIAEARAAILAP